jgi:hypothetical protein
MFGRRLSGERTRSGEAYQVNFSRLRLGIGFAVLLGIATATAGLAQYNTNPDAPISPPTGTPAPNVTAVPTGFIPSAGPSAAPSGIPTTEPSGRPRRGRRAPGPASSGSPKPEATETPEPPQFTTLDGIWEVEMQPIGKRLANYTHLGVTATGANISGYWETVPSKGKGKNNSRLPMTGTFDGRLISLSVTMPNGNTSTFSGYVEGFSDMVGIFRSSDKDTNGMAFTAEHRKKLKN